MTEPTATATATAIDTGIVADATSPDGTLERHDGRAVLRFERYYPQPLERVWRAISSPEEMAGWFPSGVEGERRVGAPLHFADEAQRAAAIEAGEPTRVEGPMLRGTVTVWEPPTVFAFTWGSERLRFELAPDGAGTRLVFTQELSHPSLSARNGAGWHACLGQLDRLLGAGPAREDVSADGSAPGGEAGPEGWAEVYARYQRRIGPPLGERVGPGGLRWERAIHVDGERVAAALSDPAERAAWGAADAGMADVSWTTEPAEVGCRYRVTHGAIGRDAELAAAWHARLIQLDLHLAAGLLVPVDPGPWVAAYEALL